MDEPTVVAETSIGESGEVVLPPAIRTAIDVEPDDVLRWTLCDGGTIRVSILDRPDATLSDLEPADVGAETDATALEGEFGAPEKD